MKPALLLVDVQNAFVPFMSERDRRIAPWLINMAIDSFHERGLPVYVICHTDPALGPQPGSEAFSYDPAIKIAPGDTQIVKNFPNAFKKTTLQESLRNADCDTLFLCGLSSTGCVLASYFGATDLDFKAFLIRDALLGPDAAQTDCIEDICDSVNLNVLQTMLDCAGLA
ncbi:MAG: isochorismatase family cysteine hydrolase [Terracidiphilus sp.]